MDADGDWDAEETPTKFRKVVGQTPEKEATAGIKREATAGIKREATATGIKREATATGIKREATAVIKREATAVIKREPEATATGIKRKATAVIKREAVATGIKREAIAGIKREAVATGIKKTGIQKKTMPESVRSLPEDDRDRQHFLSCSLGANRCTHCRVAANKTMWFKRYLIDKENPDLGSWITKRYDRLGKVFLGCSLCHCCNVPTSFGKINVHSSLAVQSQLFTNHERGAAHQNSLAIMRGASEEELATGHAPPRAAFEDVLRKTWSGKARGTIPGVGGRKKVRKIKHCLAQARLAFNKQALREAKSIALHQDGTKGIIAVRFTSCGDSLEPYSGLLGVCNLAEHYNLKADGIQSGTMQIISDATSNKTNPPAMNVDRRDKSHQGGDHELFEHVCSTVELWDTDAAEDEVLAGKLLAGARASSDAHPGEADAGPGRRILPAVAGAGARATAKLRNLKVRTRDKPHGARRLCSRAWKADPFLDDIMQKIVLGKNAIMQIIKYSETFSSRFEKNIRNLQTNPTTATNVRDLASSKHRFDSHQRPTGRGCIFWEALVVTAQSIFDERGPHDRAGKAALEFLQLINSEVMLSFGMMADAGDEVNILVRFLDCETFDKSQVASMLDEFIHRIETLFVHEQCLSTGYTRHMLQVLQRPMTVFLRGGETKTIGHRRGTPRALITRCIARLRNWAHLAKSILRAEFPNFEVLQTFSIFGLSAKETREMDDDEQEERLRKRRGHMQALCSCLKLDLGRLESQFEDHEPLAKKFFSERRMSPMEAWAEAIKLTQRRASMRTDHPCETLVAALIRFGAWHFSTSGVERLFGEGKNLAGVSKRDKYGSLYSDELQINCDKDERKVAALVQKAREIWTATYGKARAASRQIRCDSNSKSKRSSPVDDAKPSLEQWVKRRRMEVKKAGERCPKASATTEPPARVVGQDGWTDKHEKEKAFQDKKRARRFIEAIEEGTIDKAGLSEEMTLLVKMYHELEHERHKSWESGRKRAEALLAPPSPPTISGTKIYVNSGIDVGNQQQWRRLLRDRRAQQVQDRLEADLYIVEDVSQPGQRILWCCFLAGRAVCTLDYVKTAGERGTILKYKAATESKRQVWASDAFKAKHVEIFAILNALARRDASKWRWVASKEAFLDLAARRAAGGHGNEAASFLTMKELRAEEPIWWDNQKTPPHQNKNTCAA